MAFGCSAMAHLGGTHCATGMSPQLVANSLNPHWLLLLLLLPRWIRSEGRAMGTIALIPSSDILAHVLFTLLC